MTPLRQRLIHDLQLRNYSPRTVECYVSAVAPFARHFGRSPEQLGAEHTRQYQLHLLGQKASWSRFNQASWALRFLYGVTLQRPDTVPYGKRPRSLPAVLSRDEVRRLFDVVNVPWFLMLLRLTYACGLRLGRGRPPAGEGVWRWSRCCRPGSGQAQQKTVHEARASKTGGEGGGGRRRCEAGARGQAGGQKRGKMLGWGKQAGRHGAGAARARLGQAGKWVKPAVARADAAAVE
jgi:Phage integrase, N-terminal SAM-like domain